MLDRIKNIRETLRNYRRVMIVATKPTLPEFKESLKVCIVGLGIIGTIGFIIYLISILLGV
jgi:protein translocase SEC61 complex gamma subunit